MDLEKPLIRGKFRLLKSAMLTEVVLLFVVRGMADLVILVTCVKLKLEDVTLTDLCRLAVPVIYFVVLECFVSFIQLTLFSGHWDHFLHLFHKEERRERFKVYAISDTELFVYGRSLTKWRAHACFFVGLVPIFMGLAAASAFGSRLPLETRDTKFGFACFFYCSLLLVPPGLMNRLYVTSDVDATATHPCLRLFFRRFLNRLQF